MEKKEQILAALKKLGPSSPGAIGDHTGISSSLCGYHLRALEKDGSIKAKGKSNNRRYALAEQEFESAGDAPPQAGKQKKKRGKGKNNGKRVAARKATRPRARTAAAPEFMPALTADSSLICIGRTAGEDPITFNPEQTQEIVALVHAHFEA